MGNSDLMMYAYIKCFRSSIQVSFVTTGAGSLLAELRCIVFEWYTLRRWGSPSTLTRAFGVIFGLLVHTMRSSEGIRHDTVDKFSKIEGALLAGTRIRKIDRSTRLMVRGVTGCMLGGHAQDGTRRLNTKKRTRLISLIKNVVKVYVYLPVTLACLTLLRPMSRLNA